MWPRSHPRKCQDCGESIQWSIGARRRKRCDRCKLNHWRAEHPDLVAAQRQRYQEKHAEHVRELVRARVAQWRARQRQTAARRKRSR